MGQIEDTLKHEGVPNVAIKELLKTTDNGEPKKCFQELSRTERGYRSYQLSPSTVTKQWQFGGKEAGEVLTRHRHCSASSFFSIFN